MPCSARITLRNGRVLEAKDYGLKAFCWGDDKKPKRKKEDSPEEESATETTVVR